MEFLIRRTDGKWFDLPADQFAAALRPSTFPSRPAAGWGDHRIEVAGVEVSFSYEDPGIQVGFEGELPEATAEQIVAEILENVARVTGQRGRVVRIE
jgi:hypothetical protein